MALAATGSVPASEITIGESQGTVYRGLVDGFPGIFPFDGVADSLNNSLGAVFKSGVTQERGVAEFPLSGLASMCLAPEDIFDATLTFNIDDVFSTLGPGAELNGEAASAIVVHAYDADGAIAAADFQNIQEPLEAVDTTGFGTITDATLGTSGPLAFEVDVASALRARVGAATHFGILFSVGDSPTGTSLDNLGINSAGPAGIRGAAFPFLTITAPLHLGDFTCSGASTTCSWQAEQGEQAYDVIRGDLSQVADTGGVIDLGSVVCIENDSADLSTAGNADVVAPAAGSIFFYLMRPVGPSGAGRYGVSSTCKERVALLGDCP